MAKFERPTDTYTPTSTTVNINKYNDDSTAIPPVPISSTKVDADVNKLIDAVNEIDGLNAGGAYTDLPAAVEQIKTNEDAIAALAVDLVPDGDYGDITVSGGATTWTIDNEVVTEAKLSTAVQDTITKVKVSSNDTTAGDLETKLLAGAGIEMSTQNDGGNETRTVGVVGSGTATDGQVLTSDGTGGVAFEDLPSASISLAGIIEIATDAEALAGSATDKAIVPSNFLQRLFSTTGYQKFPGGLIIQWGRKNTTTNGITTFSYPTSFPNGVRFIIPHEIGGNRLFNLFNPTQSNFQIEPIGTASNSLWWIAIGY